jgi:hypothetical protein
MPTVDRPPNASQWRMASTAWVFDVAGAGGGRRPLYRFRSSADGAWRWSVDANGFAGFTADGGVAFSVAEAPGPGMEPLYIYWHE